MAMTAEQFSTTKQQIVANIQSLMNDHSLTLFPTIFDRISALLKDYILDVNQKTTSSLMTVFFEEELPKLIYTDPFVFANPFEEASTSAIATIFSGPFEAISTHHDPKAAKIALYKLLSIIDAIREAIEPLHGKSIDLIQEVLNLYSSTENII